MNIYTSQSVGTISDMRLNPNELLNRAQEQPVFIFSRSTPRAVIMDTDTFAEMQSQIEDLLLSQRAMKYDEKDLDDKTKWTTHEQMLKELNIKK